jgi:hypothetical protein
MEALVVQLPERIREQLNQRALSEEHPEPQK